MRLAFGAAAGADYDGETVYTWGRRGWGGGGGGGTAVAAPLQGCLSNSLGEEKPRFYLSARQAAEILASPEEEHTYGALAGPRSGGKSGSRSALLMPLQASRLGCAK